MKAIYTDYRMKYKILKMELFTWILAAYGMSQILVYGSIFENQRNFIHKIGNPEGEDLPNKKYYDPRRWLRLGEETFGERLKKAFEDLNNVDTL